MVFINDAIENIDLPAVVDVIFTPFLLDNFTEENLDKVFNSINSKLKKDGLWLNASFQLTGKWWQWIMLKTMFVFFKVICGIEASKLPDMYRRFEDKGYELTNQKGFFSEFISARVYKKL